MAEIRKTPPMIINTPEDGFLRVGLTTAPRNRPDQVQLAGGCGASLRIFDDGGWELRSVNKTKKPNKKGCNLIARGEGGLQILSDGDVNISAGGDFNVSAKNITMETTADDGDFTVFCKRDILLDADNNFKAFGTKCVVSAADNLITHSKGWNLIVGNPVYVYEKKSKLIPTSTSDIVKGLLDQFLLGV
ncbi:MAG: hypothetical protein CMB76_03805 [Euryarchaeota archaeon]|nr:hypothetical protein [Euryarchaeota archaeon]|tara:strand:- start:47 stop:613 length:567 start_codon:yes stop_codon:yes gene_type:complete